MAPGTTYAVACEVVRAKLEHQMNGAMPNQSASYSNDGLKVEQSCTMVVTGCAFKGGPVAQQAKANKGQHNLRIIMEMTMEQTSYPGCFCYNSCFH